MTGRSRRATFASSANSEFSPRKRQALPMQPSSDLSLTELPAVLPNSDHRRRLVHADGRKGVVVNGDRIEFQFSGGAYTVLATSYDYFEGCDHWIYLLARSGEVLDLIAMPYVFGFVEEATVVSPHELKFGYFGANDRWHLTVDESGYWSFSVASLARRRNRFFLSKRRLSIRRYRSTNA